MNSARIRTHQNLALAVSLALIAAGADAATISVNSNDDSATSTFCNLRNAITAINTGADGGNCVASGGAYGTDDTIVFSNSLANATITLAQGQLAISKSVTITGSGQTIDAHQQSRVLYVGTAVAPYPSVTASDLTLTGGSATVAGGNIYNRYGYLTLTNSTVSNGSSTADGGGIVSSYGTLTLSSTVVSGNTATGTNSSGGILVYGGTLAIGKSTISGNTGAQVGGLRLAGSATGTISQSTISGNSSGCNGNDYCSGGVYLNGSTITVTDSTVSGNSTSNAASTYLGGAFYLYNSMSTITNSTVTANSASGANYVAGGIWEADGGAGLGLNLINCTVTANTSVAASGTGVFAAMLSGYYGTGTNRANLTIANTIVSANVGNDFAYYDTTLSATYSLFGSALNASPLNDAANHNIFSNTPGLGSLANNGGPTQTMALSNSSPALGAGSISLAAIASVPLNYDQRGVSFLRTFSGTIDIGAFEAQRDRIFAASIEAEP